MTFAGVVAVINNCYLHPVDALIPAFGSPFDKLKDKEIEVIQELHLAAPRSYTTTHVTKGISEALQHHDGKDKIRTADRACGDEANGSLAASVSNPHVEEIVFSSCHDYFSTEESCAVRKTHDQEPY